jgi:hypothetical protein
MKKDMSKQEIFDTVVTHLRKQNTQSGKGGNCFYRLGELKCAVGCLISDEDYSPDMEMNAANDLILSFAKLKHLRPHIDILDESQFRLTAKVFGLEYVRP